MGDVDGRERVLVEVVAAVVVLVRGLRDDARASQQVLAGKRAHVGVVEAVEAQDALGVMHEPALGVEEAERDAVRPDGQRRVDDLRLHVRVERLADGAR